MIILMDQKQTRLWGLCQECEIQQLTSGKHEFDCVPAPFESFSDPPLSHYQPQVQLAALQLLLQPELNFNTYWTNFLIHVLFFQALLQPINLLWI